MIFKQRYKAMETYFSTQLREQLELDLARGLAIVFGVQSDGTTSMLYLGLFRL